MTALRRAWIRFLSFLSSDDGDVPSVQTPPASSLFTSRQRLVPHTVRSGDDLSPAELDAMRAGACPDCGSRELLAGPEAGLCQNVYCGSAICGSRFNFMGPFGVQRVSDASPLRPPPESALPYR